MFIFVACHNSKKQLGAPPQRQQQCKKTDVDITNNMIWWYKLYYISMMKPLAAKNSLSISVLQIKTSQQSITTNFWPLTAHKYHIMIIVTGGFSKKSFIIFKQLYEDVLQNREILQYSEEKTVLESLLIKLQVLRPATLIQPCPRRDFNTIS